MERNYSYAYGMLIAGMQHAVADLRNGWGTPIDLADYLADLVIRAEDVAEGKVDPRTKPVLKEE